MTLSPKGDFRDSSRVLSTMYNFLATTFMQCCIVASDLRTCLKTHPRSVEIASNDLEPMRFLASVVEISF